MNQNLNFNNSHPDQEEADLIAYIEGDDYKHPVSGLTNERRLFFINSAKYTIEQKQEKTLVRANIPLPTKTALKAEAIKAGMTLNNYIALILQKAAEQKAA